MNKKLIVVNNLTSLSLSGHRASIDFKERQKKNCKLKGSGKPTKGTVGKPAFDKSQGPRKGIKERNRSAKARFQKKKNPMFFLSQKKTDHKRGDMAEFFLRSALRGQGISPIVAPSDHLNGGGPVARGVLRVQDKLTCERRETLCEIISFLGFNSPPTAGLQLTPAKGGTFTFFHCNCG